MKTKIFLFVLVLFSASLPIQAKINGYLSLDYRKGQNQADLSYGSFENPLFGLIFSGELAEKIDYLAEVRFKGEGASELDQLLVEIKPSASFHLDLGLYLVPFGRYNQSNRPHQTMLISAPLNIERIYPASWRDMGILLEGRLKGLFYSAYLGNGLAESESLSMGQQFKDNNRDKAKGGRLGLALSESIELAYSYYNGKYDELNERDLTLQGVDLVWSGKSFQLLSEYSKAHLENPKDFNAGKAEGYFIQVSFDMDSFRPVVSYQRLKYEDPFHGRGFIRPDYRGEGISEEKERWALGFGYFVSQNVFLKFEYDFNREKGLELKDDSLSVQVALSF